MRAKNVGLTAGVACSTGDGAVTSATPWPAARGTPLRHGGRRTRPSAPRAPRRRGRRRRGRDRRLQPATAARRRRRIRLRSTAEPTRRPIAYATRGGSVDPSSAKRRDTGPTRWRGARARASKVARSRTRQIRPRAASGHGLGGPEARLSRRASASGVRKPWVFARLRVLGWKVRFKATGLLEGHRADSEQGSAAGGGATECTGVRAGMRNASRPGVRELPLVAIHSRCYVSSPRGATAGTRELPR